MTRPSLFRRFGAGVLIVLALGGAKVAVGHAEVKDPLGNLPDATEVAPGLLRGGSPDDMGLQALAGMLNVDGVINVGGPSVAEHAAAEFLGEAYVHENVKAGQAPSTTQLQAMADFLRRYTRGAKMVYLHDGSDGGRAVVTADMLLLVRGWSWSAMTKTMAAGDWAHLDASQVAALRDVEAALTAEHPPAGDRYGGAHHPMVRASARSAPQATSGAPGPTAQTGDGPRVAASGEPHRVLLLRPPGQPRLWRRRRSSG